MNKKNIITYLVIFNMLIILIILMSNILFIRKFINITINFIIIPMILSVFLFYILKPINKILLKRKKKNEVAALITISFFIILLIILFSIFGDYIFNEFFNIKELLLEIIDSRNNINLVNESIGKEIFTLGYYTRLLEDIQIYSYLFTENINNFFDESIRLFFNIVLITVTTFYLLKDEEALKDYFVKIFPSKYRAKIYLIIDNCDDILESYILGQIRISFAISIMVYIGYRFIEIPNALLLAIITFVLALIPFIGFLISLIIPFIIAIALGFNVFLKLLAIAFIIQVIKSKIMVPIIMGKTTKVYPVLGVFLIIGGVILIGPIGAFISIPTYLIIKITYISFKEEIYEKLQGLKK